MTADKQMKYLGLAHAMQSGVQAMIDVKGEDGTSPKHLRTGINSALVSNGALLSLLVAKGLITEDEYMDHLIETMQDEVNRYQRNLSELLQKPVILK